MPFFCNRPHTTDSQNTPNPGILASKNWQTGKNNQKSRGEKAAGSAPSGRENRPLARRRKGLTIRWLVSPRILAFAEWAGGQKP
jgi:hypothetical protein